MARRQVLVQLDDELLEALDRLADAMGISRSELLRRGARAVLDGAAVIEADRQLQAAYRRQPEVGDAWLDTAARLSVAELDEW